MGLNERLILWLKSLALQHSLYAGDSKISQDIRDALASDGCEEVEHTMKEDYTLLSTEAVLKVLRLPKSAAQQETLDPAKCCL